MSLRDQLQNIYTSHGRLTPQIVVDEARDPEHPLHHRFEWDDAVAGEAYRREQARELIRSVKITYKRSGRRKDASVRAFVSVRHDEPYTYEPVEDVIDDPVKREILLADMKRQWKTLYERFKDMEEFTTMVLEDLAV